MAGKDIITMSQEELKRLHIIHKIVDKKLKQVEAVDILDLCDRQIRRVVKRVCQEGDKGIIHKSRGKPSNRVLPQELRDRVTTLYRQRYFDFGPTLAQEKLFEIDKIKIGTQTLRNWLIEAGEWKITHRRRKHRRWRERKHHFGEMSQVDGSHHDWFEGRGPKPVFMGYIDDATGTVFGRFYEYEGIFPFMDSFKRYITKYGLPTNIYIDKHSTYKSTAKPSIGDELDSTEPLTHAGRALRELRVEVIYANSPQAKGRIERLFKTFQDRVIKEMRLKNISTIKEANKFLEWYLPIFNRRFRVEPVEKDDFHRQPPKGIDLDTILCVKTDHLLRNDFTVTHNKRLYQVLNHVNAKKVTVEEKINGKILITYKSKPLRYKEILQRQVKEKAKKAYTFTVKKTYIPDAAHPWRRPIIANKNRTFLNVSKQDISKCA